jgi:predicted  nucleic acid-binding Zn-ribbon protein
MLQKVDQQIDSVEDRISLIEKDLSSEGEITSAKKQLSELQLSLENINKEIKKIEVKGAQLFSKIKNSETRLYGGNIKNPKELEDIQVEISSLKKRIAQIEENQLELMIEFDDIQTRFNVHNNVLAKLIEEKSKNDESLISEKEELKKDLARLLIERQPVVSQIKPDLIKNYDKLRKAKNRLAVALIKEGACSACGNSMTPADIQLIKSSVDEYYCKICKRLVYFG